MWRKRHGVRVNLSLFNKRGVLCGTALWKRLLERVNAGRVSDLILHDQPMEMEQVRKLRFDDCKLSTRDVLRTTLTMVRPAFEAWSSGCREYLGCSRRLVLWRRHSTPVRLVYSKGPEYQCVNWTHRIGGARRNANCLGRALSRGWTFFQHSAEEKPCPSGANRCLEHTRLEPS
jgi:hypothetical protein